MVEFLVQLAGIDHSILDNILEMTHQRQYSKYQEMTKPRGDKERGRPHFGVKLL